MIILVTGKIGGGKTYFAVNYIVEKFYEYKESIFQYVPNRKNFRIITNIDSLDLPHSNLDLEIEKHGVNKVFSQEYIADDNVVFLIDEAQRYFDRKFYNKEVFSFFQLSRHYGVDVILITQDVNTLARELKFLCEYEIRAQARSKRTQNMFVYQYLSDDEIFKRQLIRFNKRIGALYKSQFRSESEKVPRVWKNYVIIAAVLVVVVFVGFKMAISAYTNLGGKYTTKTNNPKFIGETLPRDDIEIESHELSQNDTLSEDPKIESVRDPGHIKSQDENDSSPVRTFYSDLKKEFDTFTVDEKKKGKTYTNSSGRVTGYVIFH